MGIEEMQARDFEGIDLPGARSVVDVFLDEDEGLVRDENYEFPQAEKSGMNRLRRLFHIHISERAARKHYSQVIAFQSGAGGFFGFHPLQDYRHRKITACEECGRRYREAQKQLD